jgi:hypothetical protein
MAQEFSPIPRANPIQSELINYKDMIPKNPPVTPEVGKGRAGSRDFARANSNLEVGTLASGNGSLLESLASLANQWGKYPEPNNQVGRLNDIAGFFRDLNKMESERNTNPPKGYQPSLFYAFDILMTCLANDIVTPALMCDFYFDIKTKAFEPITYSNASLVQEDLKKFTPEGLDLIKQYKAMHDKVYGPSSV